MIAATALSAAVVGGLQMPQTGIAAVSAPVADAAAAVGSATAAGPDPAKLRERTLRVQADRASRSRAEGDARIFDDIIAAQRLADERQAAEKRVAEEQRLAAEAAAAEVAAAEAATAETARLAEQARNRWVAPLESYRITGTFGASGRMWSRTHTGLDLAAPTGTPVHAAATGTVIASRRDGSYGLKVEIEHSDGTVTYYAHLSSAAVEAGAAVLAGDVIGEVGSTGNSSGPHLHIEVRLDGITMVDPHPYLAERGVTL